MTLNHVIRREDDIQLAIIEGTEVEGLCGHRFVPTVTVGTSGGAHVPGAPMCSACETIDELLNDALNLRVRAGVLEGTATKMRMLLKQERARIGERLDA